MAERRPSTRRRYYVYIYRDPRPGKCSQPIYVGKGTRDRAWVHSAACASNGFFRRFLIGLQKIGLEPTIEIYEYFSTEVEALSCERDLIAKLGRRILGEGPLLNVCAGGFQPTVCATRVSQHMRSIWDDPVRRAERIAAIAAGLQQTGSKQSDAYRAKAASRQSALWSNPEWRARTVQKLRDAVRPKQTLTRAERSANAKRGWASRSVVERSSQAVATWATRRARLAAQQMEAHRG